MSENTFEGTMSGQPTTILRFGVFELDPQAEQLRRNGLTIRMQPQPFKLLRLLVAEAGHLVTRDQIRAVLWKNDTFVDFEQGVNFAIKQVREALDDDAERPRYIQTVPKRGYRFLAPVEPVRQGPAQPAAGATSDLQLDKALWANIVELRLAEEARRKRLKLVTVSLVVAAVVLAGLFLMRSL